MSSSEDSVPDDEDGSSDNDERLSSSASKRGSTPNRSGGPFASEHRGRKRKLAKDGLRRSRSRLKRLKLMYSDRYRLLYNQIIEELNAQKLPKGPVGLQASQIGVSLWSVEEKCTFFGALARRGRLDLQSVVSAIGTKSEPETREYAELLRQSTTKRELDVDERSKIFDISSIEAAVEVGPDCDHALEAAADALSMLQYQDEGKAERESHPQTWLLNSSIAKWADRGLRDGERGEREVLDALPAAGLLNLKEFIKLSKDFFMNSGDVDRNWRTYAEKRQTPSIMHTAFTDLHALTVSLTKRLISSALFLASSRIRAETSECETPKAAVRRKDVLAALEVLGVLPNAKQVWIGMARKSKLRVYENVRNNRAWGKHYNYDEVEQYLTTDDNRRGRYRSRTGSPSLSERALSQPSSDKGSQSDESHIVNHESSPASDAHSAGGSALEDSDSDSDSDTEPLDPPSPTDQEDRQEQQELLQDVYMESLDQRASQAEERRLWELLGDDPAKKTGLHDDVEVPKRPAPPEKTREDFVEWRDWVDYAAEWETLETPVPEERFRANRAMGRNGRGRGAGYCSSSSETGSEGDVVGGEENAVSSKGSSRVEDEDSEEM